MATIGEMIAAKGKGLAPRPKLAAHRAELTTKVEYLVESVAEAKNPRRQATIVLAKLRALAVEIVNKGASYSTYDHTVVCNAITDVKEASNA